MSTIEAEEKILLGKPSKGLKAEKKVQAVVNSRKQHSKPYGCTFLTCNKRFGNKNDWKRHENSEHFHIETWRCDGEKVGGGACAKVCYRRETFEDHLVKAHQMVLNSDPLKAKLDNCRIGRNCQSRFWCGFCKNLVELKKRGVEAWTERFDHIDDHIMGRHGLPKQSIRDWIPMDHSDSNSNGNSSDSTLAGDDEEGVKRKRCKDDSGRNGPAKRPRKDTRSQSIV